MQQEADSPKFIPRLGGLNERLRFSNPNAEEFDGLENLVQQRAGILQRINGILPLSYIEGERILSIHQCFDDRENVLIQTNFNVYLLTEDELFDRVPATNLTPVILIEEESMSKGIITQQTAAGAHSGTPTAALAWATAPLSAIVSQLNPDGLAASFITALAANVFTLASGSYRFTGWSAGTGNAAGVVLKARLFNVTSGLPAWNGLTNVDGRWDVVTGASRNVYCPFGGDLTIGGATQFRIEMYSSTTFADGMGKANSPGGVAEVYRWIEILKTN